jgi:hypothetical protein
MSVPGESRHGSCFENDVLDPQRSFAAKLRCSAAAARADLMGTTSRSRRRTPLRRLLNHLAGDLMQFSPRVRHNGVVLRIGFDPHRQLERFAVVSDLKCDADSFIGILASGGSFDAQASIMVIFMVAPSRLFDCVVVVQGCPTAHPSSSIVNVGPAPHM